MGQIVTFPGESGWGQATITGSATEVDAAELEALQAEPQDFKAYLQAFVTGLADGRMQNPYDVMRPEHWNWNLGYEAGQLAREKNRRELKRLEIEELTGKPFKGKV